MKINLLLKILAIALLIISCNKNRIVEYYPDAGVRAIYYINDNGLKDGKYEAFFKNGKIKNRMYFKNGKNVGTSFFYFKNKDNYIKTIIYHNDSIARQRTYYENDTIRSEGNILYDTIRIGNWKYYDSTGVKSEIIEYFNINTKSYLNQRWVLNKKGDTIDGNYYKLKMNDTISIQKLLRVYFLLSRPILSGSSQLFVCIPKENNLKDDFSNQESIEWDTIENISLKYKGNEKYKDWNHDVIFDLQPKLPNGKKHLQGFLFEKEKTPKDSFDFVTRKIYFDIPYYVKGK